MQLEYNSVLCNRPEKSNNVIKFKTNQVTLIFYKAVFAVRNKKNMEVTNMTGKVKWFNSEKGYGFITTDEGQDIFAHYSQIQKDGFKSLDENERVSFEVVDGDKGPQASNIESI